MKKLILVALFALSVFAGSSSTSSKEGPIPLCVPCMEQAR